MMNNSTSTLYNNNYNSSNNNSNNNVNYIDEGIYKDMCPRSYDIDIKKDIINGGLK